MNDQEQKFSVGDKVTVVSDEMPIEYRKKVYIVVAVEYDYFINSNTNEQALEFAYKLNLPKIGRIEWYTAGVLRPYDPPSKDSFEEVMENLNNVEVLQ